MPKELTRTQKLKKYAVPKEVLVATETIMYPSEDYDPVELMEKIEFEVAKYPEYPTKKLTLEPVEDYYDSYNCLVLIVSRPLTEAEQDVLIAKGDKEAAKKEKSFKKKQDEYIKALKKKYPNYELPPLPEELGTSDGIAKAVND